MRFSVFAALLLFSCTPAQVEQKDPDRQRNASPVAASSQVKGRWQVELIDDVPVASAPDKAAKPYLAITDNSIGGSLGCNSFGALALLSDNQFTTHYWTGTAIGCRGLLGAQELALGELFFERPRVQFDDTDTLRLVSANHSVKLTRTDGTTEPAITTGSAELAGTRWLINHMDGLKASSSPNDRYLEFFAAGWSGLASCATLGGTWKREGDRISVGEQISTTEQNCREDDAKIDDAFAALMRSNPRYLVGPNGELLIAGAGHSLVGMRAR